MANVSVKAFEYVLSRNFETRGLHRIQIGSYRLLNLSNQQMINPRSGAKFSLVFKPGHHLRMSIYFDWHEVPPDGCPKCRTKQATSPGVETVCNTCNFAFTPGIVEEITEGSPDTQDQSSDMLLQSTPNGTPRRATYTEPDRPEHFNRVSVGAEKRRIHSSRLEKLRLDTFPAGHLLQYHAPNVDSEQPRQPIIGNSVPREVAMALSKLLGPVETQMTVLKTMEKMQIKPPVVTSTETSSGSAGTAPR